MTRVILPGMRLRSLNQLLRQNPKARRRQSRKEKNDVGVMLLARVGVNRPQPPIVVTVTRIGPRMFDAHDNLPASCKYLVDQIAKYLGIDDSDPRVTWRYEQRLGPFAAEITIEKAEVSR